MVVIAIVLLVIGVTWAVPLWGFLTKGLPLETMIKVNGEMVPNDNLFNEAIPVVVIGVFFLSGVFWIICGVFLLLKNNKTTNNPGSRYGVVIGIYPTWQYWNPTAEYARRNHDWKRYRVEIAMIKEDGKSKVFSREVREEYNTYKVGDILKLKCTEKDFESREAKITVNDPNLGEKVYEGNVPGYIQDRINDIKNKYCAYGVAVNNGLQNTPVTGNQGGNYNKGFY